ncbi:unnamed protein product [Periconia digitata]|uniref:Secreted protein n=1 Tax=Periconia digitata TaxID=1303443 RepID=A0A9W4ULD9_9PLEO|nr:unnamed protein product [Periconia digitata]
MILPRLSWFLPISALLTKLVNCFCCSIISFRVSGVILSCLTAFPCLLDRNMANSHVLRSNDHDSRGLRLGIQPNGCVPLSVYHQH